MERNEEVNELSNNSSLSAAIVVSVALVSSCAGPSHITAPADAAALLGDAWFEARAKQLAITAEAAKTRDAAFSASEPPDPDMLGHFVREQGAAIWAEQCSRCHGIDGEPPPGQQPPAKKWGTMGTTMGFFFGGDKMRAGIFRIITEGGKQHEDGTASAMPAWGETLAREQIWALVYHIESL